MTTEMSGPPGAASAAPRCTECDAALAARVLSDEVVTVREVSVVFRRGTDFLVCERCLTTFRVEDVRDGHPLPV
jgi:uncharacterized protein with PIN domain